ncbi:LLM class flavin-dependent oxidoreductase, partial [Streptomyces sp. 8L]|nr:LLM class flavin-dependent oxidoreductase [Streptomyces sp. 8L]
SPGRPPPPPPPPPPAPPPPPPRLRGGRAAATRGGAPPHADVWNMPGGIEDGAARGALLDRFCEEIGRDPASITRSIVLPVSYERPGETRRAIDAATGAGFQHIVLGLPAPYPEGVARWVADELIGASAQAH